MKRQFSSLQNVTFFEALSPWAKSSTQVAPNQDDSSTTKKPRLDCPTEFREASVNVPQHPDQVLRTPNSCMPAVQTDRSPATLLTIPAEIRSKILKYALVSPDRIQIDVIPRRYRWCEYHIAWTCRQIYHEAVPIFFTQNTFCFSIRKWPLVKEEWLKQIGKENWPLIRSVHLTMWPNHAWPDLNILEGLKRISTKNKIYDLEEWNAFSGSGWLCPDWEDGPPKRRIGGPMSHCIRCPPSMGNGPKSRRKK